jgi:diguanylate cyclase (GGDEF)-like protein
MLQRTENPGFPDTMPTAKKQKILIVDNDPFTVLFLNELLGSDNELHYAADEEKTLEIAIAENVDLILLDIMLPDTDGYTICRTLKRNPQTAGIPVIFISAKAETDDEVRGLEAGAVDYITKPISAPKILARVRTHLELKRYRDLLEDLSNIDGLTGIANRRRFDAVLAHEWSRSMRAQTKLSLILLDIDHFKQYNDLYGHSAGDTCIKKIAQALRLGLLRTTDLAARFGGDEFACILPETDAAGAENVARTLHASIDRLVIRHVHLAAGGIVTVSMGIATAIPTAGTQVLSLIEAADNCLYDAKNEGRNQTRSIDLGRLTC